MEEEDDDNLFDLRLNELGLPNLLEQKLSRLGVLTAAGLTALTPAELKGLGPKHGTLVRRKVRELLSGKLEANPQPSSSLGQEPATSGDIPINPAHIVESAPPVSPKPAEQPLAAAAVLPSEQPPRAAAAVLPSEQPPPAAAAVLPSEQPPPAAAVVLPSERPPVQSVRSPNQSATPNWGYAVLALISLIVAFNGWTSKQPSQRHSSAPTRADTVQPASSAYSVPPEATSRQCAAMTKKGTRCSRTAKRGRDYCWQH